MPVPGPSPAGAMEETTALVDGAETISAAYQAPPARTVQASAVHSAPSTECVAEGSP
ncbi:hypothetical protein SAMN05216275_13380 [Streptosporangium canum]|uniref:Uncharacterized protein n=1 Tax=Streptosporangium canum TaxID=324952 RepID=A0A1I4BWU7_9ACTN|nr:hypothetical protein SAMN05216275_13380 [Streptosporangium canum]